MNYPAPVWPYSPFTKVWDFIYFSGQIGLDPESMKLEEWIWKQTQRVCENIKAVCEEAGCKIQDIFKTSIFLADMADFERVNNVYGIYFQHKPARSCVAVKELPKWALVEIEVIAYKK